jgi:putative endonuclease
MKSRREQAEIRGRRGETIAAWWLRLQGWSIVAQRVRTQRGEVDLVARRGKTLAFIEVKTRRKDSDLSLAIDHNRLRRVAAAADILCPRYAKGAENIRIDVILVAPWRLPHHLINVWHG